MRKLFLCLCFMLMVHICEASITVESFTTADDVTIAHLESFRTTVVDAINSADGGLLTAGSVPTTKLADNANPEKRWDETFNDFVYTGLLPPTTIGTLISVTTAGTAYIDGVRVVKDATSKTYTASKHTFVDLSKTGTYTYSEVAINASEPSVTANSIRLARVSTDTTKVLEVRDDRSTTPTILGSATMVFEGATNDAYETTIAITDPTADRTITLPDASGTITVNPVNTARAYLSSAQENLISGAITKVLLDAETFDVNNEFASNKFTAKTAGYYLVTGQVAFVGSSVVIDKSYGAYIYRNGAGITFHHSSTGNTDNSFAVSAIDIIYLSVDDYIELYVYENAGVDTVDLQNSALYTFLSVQRLTD